MVSDAALQKTCSILKQDFFHNCKLIHRDPAHMVRIAVREPLVRSDHMSEVLGTLFENDNALVKDIRYSSLWQENLRDSQHRCLHYDRVLG